MQAAILTLAERDALRRARRREAISALEGRLAGYARARGGRFILYGSVARGEDRPDSDVDVLVDFPSTARLAAALYAETACAEAGLRGDVRDIEIASERLLARARAEGRVLA
ncbi:MAG: nucleotidyltransferase family protein [Hyphomonadaceae bacterium]